MKKILIVGCGAIGGILAAKLSKVAEVMAYDINSKLVKEIKGNGIRIINSSITNYRIEITNNLKKLKNFDFDLVLLSTKAYDTKKAILNICKYFRPASVLTVQNGLKNVEILRHFLPKSSINCGITTMAARVITDGEIKLFTKGTIYLSPCYKSSLKYIRGLENLFKLCDFDTKITSNHKGIIWSKLIFNSIMNPFTVVTNSEYNIIRRDKGLLFLIKGAIAEGMTVAKKIGIKLYFDPHEIVEKIQHGKMNNFKYKGSMYYDIADGKKSEIDFITGELIKQADKLDMKVPILKAFYLLTKRIENLSQPKHYG